MQSEPTSSREIIAYLSNQFPHCFTLDGEAKPLKIGIFQDVVERFSDNEQSGQAGLISKKKLRLAMRLYTASWRYLYSIKEGANRVDLEGNPCDVISSEQAAHAKAKLKESKEKVKARKIAENNKNKSNTQQDPRLVKPKSKSSTAKAISASSTKNSTKQPDINKKNSINQTLHKVRIEQLHIGDKVKVRLGSKPVPAVISDIEKEQHIRVKVPSGMELIVAIDHILV